MTEPLECLRLPLRTPRITTHGDDDDDVMSNAVSTNGSTANEKSSSPPSDYEVFDYEEADYEEFPYQRISSVDGFGEDDSDGDEEGEGCGTPLNLELAQLLNQGIVSKTKANFGISKNIETLEKSTMELSSLNGSPKRRPKDLLKSGITAGYQRSPDLFLRRSDDEYYNEDEDGEEDVDFVRIMKRKSRTPTETVFENGSNEPSPSTSAFRFTEPSTSYHSGYGYDNERIMFEGIP